MLHITFRHLDSSDTIRALAEELLAKLSRSHGDPLRCHLVLEDNIGAHAHREQRFAAHVELSLPHEGMLFDARAAHEDALSAVRAAFERAERQLTRREERLSTAAQRGAGRGAS